VFKRKIHEIYIREMLQENESCKKEGCAGNGHVERGYAREKNMYKRKMHVMYK